MKLQLIILIIYKNVKKKAFCGLCYGLLENLTNDQQNSITIENRNKKKIIFFQNLVNCFEGVCKLDVGQLKSECLTSCICGKTDITDLFYIRNIANLEKYIIGSTCACNWFKKEKDGHCTFCNRLNNDLGNCINCTGIKCIKSAISIWKNHVKEKKKKGNFGKYKNVLTYYQLCSRFKKYVEWCLSEDSKIHSSTKNRLRYFAGKTK